MKVSVRIQLTVILLPCFLLIVATAVWANKLPEGCQSETVSSRRHGSNVKQFAELAAIRDWGVSARRID